MNLATSNPNKFRVLFQDKIDWFSTMDFAQDYVKKLKNRNRLARLKYIQFDYHTKVTTIRLSY
jgi:hypothetical protein